MKATLIDHMGTDLTVVNAARVSFDKESQWEASGFSYVTPNTVAGRPDRKYTNVLNEADKKLVKYLATHNHWTPFAHCTATFRIKAPIFVARQLFKHKVGLTENEISRRYVDDKPEFYIPDKWRRKAENKKQGSGGEFDSEDNWQLGNTYENHIRDCLDIYEAIIEDGVAPEQARMVLPQSMYTEWYWTGSMAAFSRVCNLRLDPDAQHETGLIANMISEECEKLWPISWTAMQGQ